MKYIKKIILIVFLMFILLTRINTFAYLAEENTDYTWLQDTISDTEREENTPILNSRYIIALDRDSKCVMYGKNQNKRVPMASTTKIMTVIVCMENMENLKLDTQVQVCKQAASIGGSRLGLKTGDKITMNDLLYGLMLCSGNDAAIQIAVSIAGSVEDFVELMNRKALELGLRNTHFVTPHGLDNEAHYTTAYELALITDYALNNPQIAKIVNTKMYTVKINNYNKTIKNTNELLGCLNGVNGVKTGFTNGAGRCLVTSVERNNFNIITVILGADTKKIRTKDSIKLIEYIYSNYELVDLEQLIIEEFKKWKSTNEEKLYIYKGEKNNVKTKLGAYKYKLYPVNKEKIKDIDIDKYNMRMYFEAPICKESLIGKIIVKTGEEEITRVNILTNESIKRKGIKDYFKLCLREAI